MDANVILPEVDKIFSEAAESFDAELDLPGTQNWQQMTLKQKAAQEQTTTNDQ